MTRKLISDNEQCGLTIGLDAEARTWLYCPLRPKHDSEWILAPIADDPEHFLVVAAAWPYYILPLGDMVVTLDDEACPPDLEKYLHTRLTREQVDEFANICVRIARMHEKYAKIFSNDADDGAEYAAHDAEYTAPHADDDAQYAYYAAGYAYYTATVAARAAYYAYGAAGYAYDTAHAAARAARDECLQWITLQAVRIAKECKTC